MNRKTYVTMSVYYSLIYMAAGSLTSFIGLYFAEVGMNNGQVGLISALMAAVGILSQPVIGTISDKASKKNRILSIVLLLCAITTWLVPFAKKDFLLITAAISLFSVFNNAINPLSDTITLELAQKDNFKFSKVRMVGSLGYALMAAISGKIFSINVMYLFPVVFVLRFLAYLTSLFIPGVKGYKETTNNLGYLELFKDKKLNLLYMYTFVLSCTQGFFYSFHAIYSKEVGITTDIIGIAVMIGSFSQFPFMIMFDKFYNKLGVSKLLIISGFAYVVRWAVYALALNEQTLFLLWSMHGLNYMVVYLCIVEYVHRNVPKELYTRGQMMNTIVLFGISNIFGVYIGGKISDYTGIGNVFMGSSVICLIAVLLFIIFSKKLASGKRAIEVKG